MTSENSITGRGISAGLAFGSVVLIKRPQVQKTDSSKIINAAAEVERFQKAVLQVKAKVEKLINKTRLEIGEDSAQIFEAHLMILDDPELIETTETKINSENKAAEIALQEVAESIIETLSQINDDYLRERVLDMKDLRDQILNVLVGSDLALLDSVQEPIILAGHDITPSQVASLDRDKLLGFVTEIGGKTSHTAILARNLEIPAISGIKNIESVFKLNSRLIIDGTSGVLQIDPDLDRIAEFKSQKQKIEREKEELLKLKAEPSLLKDGTKISLEGNIGTPGDLPLLEKYGAEGIGLFRTEFVFMDRSRAPSELEQFEIYKKVLSHQSPNLVIIRTLDVGGDKNLSYLNIPKEENPFLGLRAVRYCLKNPEFFKMQFRALLRASVFGNLGIMIPMIASVNEVTESKKLFEEAKRELKAASVPFSDKIKFGIMIETPAAAITADLLAEHVDFFSIGTNDLIQYVCAVDRMNEEIQDLYEPFHPAVLRMIKSTAQAAQNKGIFTGVCGDLGSHPILAPLLLGLGVNHLSMSPAQILRMKKRLKNWTLAELEAIANAALKMSTANEIEKFLTEKLQ